ncbi:hypothetical protein [Actinacidiphila acidipaludis]|uniref:Tellurite resistance protein n=1 Tax=Actinacidiphila acidipaludis TaxID=2873382 RepID=A0ABS7QHA2_9ACTN|nr:hypothetical protein [Streptomyces acidipaludis]MBY8882548.1 hypothetical protein [Streptomyces acidipaludis]
MTVAGPDALAATDPTSPPHENAGSPTRAAAGHPSDGHQHRAARINLMSVSLGTAGLGGAWQAAATTHPAALPVSDALYVASGLIWLLLLAQYLRHGGTRWRHLRHDISHPAQGFALAYVPIIGILITGHFSRFGHEGARWAYAVLTVLAALIAARLLAHWLTGGLTSAVLHPGLLLPVSSAPFIASATASTLGLHAVAQGAFAVGMLYWLAFGTVILGALVTRGPLPAPARPALTVLAIPPATGGIAWIAAHRGVVDPVAHGFAGILLFTLLLLAFLGPDLRGRPFHPGLWVFSFPLAASSTFAIRLITGTHPRTQPALTWAVVAVATAGITALAAATAAYALRRTRGARR